MAALIERYEVLLFDAWGVLTDNFSALPHARQLIDHLNEIKKPYFIVSNGSSQKVPHAGLHAKGLNVAPERAIHSGFLVKKWLKENNQHGKRFIILGADAASYLLEEIEGERAGFHDTEADGVLIANQGGYDLLDAVNGALTFLIRKIEKGEKPIMLLGNPDLMFVPEKDKYGITCGMIAVMLERALELRLGSAAPKFIRLGKPFNPIFEEARRRAGTDSLVMIGDQMETDVLGARNAGIDSVLLGTGVCDIANPATYAQFLPTYVMEDLSL